MSAAQPFKDKPFSLAYLRTMIQGRVLEERLIKMAKSSDGFFWIGGPGEEAFNVALGKLVKKGHGSEFDYLHLHYRNNTALLAMGAPMLDMIRQMRNVSTDPFSGGRNFVSHVARKEWNVLPVTSTIETQFAIAPGTAMAQRRLREQGLESGITIVVGGDAGTAEGDFASCLVWSMIVTNNQFGISTPAQSQHGERHIADRGKAFGMQTAVVNGNSPEKIWEVLSDAMDYVRTKGKPFLLEVEVSRLYGHSSSSGGNRIEEACCVDLFAKKLIKNGWVTETEVKSEFDKAWAEANAALDLTRQESWPDPSTVLDHSFVGSRGGLPGRDS